MDQQQKYVSPPIITPQIQAILDADERARQARAARQQAQPSPYIGVPIGGPGGRFNPFNRMTDSISGYMDSFQNWIKEGGPGSIIGRAREMQQEKERRALSQGR